MNPLSKRFIKSLLIISGCFCISASLLAIPSKLESDSPFLPPGYNAQKLAQQKPPPPPVIQGGPLASELEFRGVVQLNGTYQFSLFKKSENKGYWIAEGGSESGITVKDFDLDSMSINVTSNGRSEQLTLMAASENPLPVVAASPSAPIPTPTAPIVRTPVNQPQINRNNTPRRRTIPRRRVILPSKK